jgi:aminocarboxymuconate-semialdehyde decarboxylase
MVIDIHAHFVPPSLISRFSERRSEFPDVIMLEEGGSVSFRFANGEPTRPVIAALTDLGAQLEDMKARRIDHAILSLWTDLEGYELPPAQGLAWSRFINECMQAELSDLERFSALASVPLQCGEHAAKVLEEALGLGFVGAMIGTSPHGASGGNLDDPSLDAFWQTASRLRAAIYVHPMFLCNEPRLKDFGLINTVGRIADSTIAIGRLLSSGVLQRHPGIQLIVSHGGGAIPYALGRFRRTYDAEQRKFADPDDGFARLYFDTCVYDPQALGFLVDRAGADRVMLGSDAPMSIAEKDPVGLVEAVRLRSEEREAILGANARRVFRLRTHCKCGE